MLSESISSSLTVLTEHDSFLTVILNAERRMTNRRSGEKSLHALEFNDLNIHLYLTLNYGTASEHSDFDFMVLYNVFVLSWGLITQNSIRTISDLDRSRLTDNQSAENASIEADTDPEYRIYASLNKTAQNRTAVLVGLSGTSYLLNRF